MSVTRHPPRRSVRAELPHTAPPSDNNTHSLIRIFMTYSRSWQPLVKQSVHLFPRHKPFLAPSPKHTKPSYAYLVSKFTHRLIVAWYTIISIVSYYNRPKPSANLLDRMVHTPPQLAFDLTDFDTHSFLYRVPQDCEFSVFSPFTTYMCESKECKRLRFPFPTSRTSFDGISSILDKSRLFGMQFQSKP